MSFKILIAGSMEEYGLEKSYIRAANKLKIKTVSFDVNLEQNYYIRGGVLGFKLHQFLPIEQWVRKMNRKLIVLAQKEKPDLCLFVTNSHILPGTLVCMKTILPKIKIAWIWPDTPLNLENHVLSNSGNIDLFATYSYSSIEPFIKMGFKNVKWLPLAGDSLMHGLDEPSGSWKRDLGFIGGWRPEREKYLSIICKLFPDLRIEIQGPTWYKDCKDKFVKKVITGKGLYQQDLAKFFNTSRININIIDDTNYPAANMRFFEIPMAYGLQLCTSCPEQEKLFLHNKHVLYFNNDKELILLIKWILENPLKADYLRRKSKSLVEEKHTYLHRLKFILSELGFNHLN